MGTEGTREIVKGRLSSRNLSYKGEQKQYIKRQYEMKAWMWREVNTGRREESNWNQRREAYLTKAWELIQPKSTTWIQLRKQWTAISWGSGITRLVWVVGRWGTSFKGIRGARDEASVRPIAWATQGRNLPPLSDLMEALDNSHRCPPAH